MKHSLKSVFLLALLSSAPAALTSSRCDNNFSCKSDNCSFNGSRCSEDFSCERSDGCGERDRLSPFTDVRTVFIPRSQGANTAREMVGWEYLTHSLEENYCSGTTLTYEYTRSFKGRRLAKSIFGASTLEVQGARVPNRNPHAILAENLGLSETFAGSLRFCPRIENHILELDYFMELDCLCKGLYFRAHAPLTWTRWRLNARETNNGSVVPLQGSAVVNTTGVPAVDYIGGFLSANPAGVTPANSILEALSGRFTTGELTEPICAGRIINCDRKKFRLADIDLILGYNWVQEDACYQLGLYAQYVAPTGNRPDYRTVFSPIVGNGHFNEFGGGLLAYASLWRNDSADLGFFIEGNVTHMFRNCQTRLFDFTRNGALSRYLLLKEFNADLAPTGNVISASCFNLARVETSRKVKGDVSFKLAYSWCDWEFDLGYNLYGHSEERLRFKKALNNGNYGIKGLLPTNVLNYTNVGGVISSASTPGLLNSTESTATMFAFPGVTVPVDNQLTAAQVVASSTVQGAIDFPAVLGDSVAALLAQGTLFAPSATPVLVSPNQFNLRSGATPSMLTHKIFGYINYSMADDECGYKPFMGIGVEGEFASFCHRNRRDCSANFSNDCSRSRNCSKNNCSNDCSDICSFSSCSNDCSFSNNCNTNCNGIAITRGRDNSCNTSCDNSCNNSCDTSVSCNVNSCQTPCNVTGITGLTGVKACRTRGEQRRLGLNQWGIWFKTGIEY